MLKKSFFGKKLSGGFQDIQYSCIVNFLDDRKPLTVTFQKDTVGKHLIDHVCSSLNLAEKDYFGLRFVDKEKQRHWLDPKKPAYRQLKGDGPMVLCFRVKYYPSDPFKMKEEITRYFLFLQLERDLLHGRLLCNQDELTMLASYLLQAKLGEFDDEKTTKEGLIKTNFLPKGVDLDKIMVFYKKIGDVPVEAAEEQFVRAASNMDTYGVDPHSVKDADGNVMYVGLSHTGIMTFKGNKKSNCFSWRDISRLDFEGKNFIIHVLIKDSDKKKKQILSFKCPSASACKHLWKCAVEQQCFFTLDSGDLAPKVRANKRLFRRPSTFKFSGLSESEIWLSTTSLNREEPIVQRSISNPQFFRNSHGYETLPASFKIGPYHLASGDSLESSSSSLIIASRANISTANPEDLAQKSPLRSTKDNVSPMEIEEKITRNNLEQVPEDEVEEVIEDANCEANSPLNSIDIVADGIIDKALEKVMMTSPGNEKKHDLSIHPPEAKSSEFFDSVQGEETISSSLPHIPHKNHKKHILIFFMAFMLIVSIIFYFAIPEQRSILYSYPGQLMGIVRNVLCQLGL